MPSPHAADQHRRKRQEASEAEPALCPVHIGHDGFDLIRVEAAGSSMAMVGLLTSLPNTQLTRRLAREGRLADDYSVQRPGEVDASISASTPSSSSMGSANAAVV